ncbi:MAG: hypothetical protein RLZZ308_367, partial [Candidatus Parcubacteria bacterium]
KSWTINGNICSGTTQTKDDGQTSTVTNTALGKIGSATFTCSDGTWGGAGNGATCTPPPFVVSAVVTGQYYSSPNPGHITLTCDYATGYRVERASTGATFTSGVYSGPVTINVTESDTYIMYCTNAGVDSIPVTRRYEATPPSPSISLVASPRTIPKDTDTVLDWTIEHPLVAPQSCSFVATPICANNICSQEQLSAVATLNYKLQNDRLDSSFLGSLTSSPTIKSTLQFTASEIAQFINNPSADWTKRGKKTLRVKYSTEFRLSCGTPSQATRVLVTTSVER